MNRGEIGLPSITRTHESSFSDLGPQTGSDGSKSRLNHLCFPGHTKIVSTPSTKELQSSYYHNFILSQLTYKSFGYPLSHRGRGGTHSNVYSSILVVIILQRSLTRVNQPSVLESGEVLGRTKRDSRSMYQVFVKTARGDRFGQPPPQNDNRDTKRYFYLSQTGPQRNLGFNVLKVSRSNTTMITRTDVVSELRNFFTSENVRSDTKWTHRLHPLSQKKKVTEGVKTLRKGTPLTQYVTCGPFAGTLRRFHSQSENHS